MMRGANLKIDKLEAIRKGVEEENKGAKDREKLRVERNKKSQTSIKRVIV